MLPTEGKEAYPPRAVRRQLVVLRLGQATVSSAVRHEDLVVLVKLG